ncbi:transcription initiation factor IID, 31kD subunit-domain-containing protein [Blastocladiella britannica]|nr:transcription initiation factor IID, 31kD subunit-domain-containing protein [Blastocladiella britannica]
MTDHAAPGASGAGTVPAVPTAPLSTTTTTTTADKPRDARLIELVLASSGIYDCDELVVPMLLEFAHRHVADLLAEASAFAEHAASGSDAASRRRTRDLTVADVRLAVQSKVNHAFTGPPPKDFMLELAAEKNAAPLPPVLPRHGLRLPPRQYTLTGPNFAIAPKTVTAADVASATHEYLADNAAAAAAAAAATREMEGAPMPKRPRIEHLGPGTSLRSATAHHDDETDEDEDDEDEDDLATSASGGVGEGNTATEDEDAMDVDSSREGQ